MQYYETGLEQKKYSYNIKHSLKQKKNLFCQASDPVFKYCCGQMDAVFETQNLSGMFCRLKFKLCICRPEKSVCFGILN